MSWRDRIGDGTAEFRGITLYLERGSISPGRRVEVHEYPLRDDPYAEAVSYTHLTLPTKRIV